MRLSRSATAAFLGLLLAGGSLAVAPGAGAASKYPGAVRSLTAVGGVGTVTAKWLAPTGTPAAESYDVVGAGCGLDGALHRQTATTVVFSGLPDRCHVTVVVYAHGTNGDGVGTVTSASTTDAPNGAVQNLTAVAIDGAMRLRWTAPALSGQSAPVGYKVTATAGSTVLAALTVSTLGVDLVRMPPHTVVSFVVTPVNLAGSGVPNVVNGVPGIAVAAVGKTRLSVARGHAIKLQIKVTAAFTKKPEGNDAINVYAQKGSTLTKIGRIATSASGIATYTAHLSKSAMIVMRPGSNSVQGILFRISVT